MAVAASATALAATQVSAPPTLMRWAPAAVIWRTVRCGTASTFTGLDTASQTALISATFAQAGRVQHVSPHRLERLQPLDGVLEVRIPANMVLSSRRQHEREVETVGRFGGSLNSFYCLLTVVQSMFRVPVLDRAADGAGLRGPPDCVSGVLGPRAIAVLKISRDGQLGQPVEFGDVAADLVEGRAAVEPAEGERQARACGRERCEAERLQHPCGPRVPRVRDHKGLARV